MLAGALCLLLFQAGFASFEFCLEKYGNLILADGILWRLNYFTSVRSRLTSAYNNNGRHLRGFGVALRSRLQPGAQFVSLSTLSCEFFDCEIFGTSQKSQVSIFTCCAKCDMRWRNGTPTLCYLMLLPQSFPYCPCHH